VKLFCFGQIYLKCVSLFTMLLKIDVISNFFIRVQYSLLKSRSITQTMYQIFDYAQICCTFLYKILYTKSEFLLMFRIYVFILPFIYSFKYLYICTICLYTFMFISLRNSDLPSTNNVMEPLSTYSVFGMVRAQKFPFF
jgi:hypothetical protein